MADLMTAVSVTRGIIRWDLNCYAGGSQAVSRRDLRRHGLEGEGLFSGCHSNIYCISFYRSFCAEYSQGITCNYPEKQNKQEHATSNYIKKVNTGSVYSS